MKNYTFRLWVLLILVLLGADDLSAQRRSRGTKNPEVELLIRTGDANSEAGKFAVAQDYYFQALKIPKIGKPLKDTLNSRILKVKKYLHFESMMRNAKYLEDNQRFDGAKKFYEDAFVYAQDERLELEDSIFERLNAIHQLIDIYNLLEKSRTAEAQSDYKLTQKYFLDAVEKADLVKSELRELSFSPAISAKIDSLMQFMVFKNDTVLNYKDFFPKDYKQIYYRVVDDLREYLHTVHNMPNYAIRFISTIDTTGLTTTVLSNDNIRDALLLTDSVVERHLYFTAANIQLLQPRIYGFPMNAIAEFYFEFGESESMAKVSKKGTLYKVKVAKVINSHHKPQKFSRKCKDLDFCEKYDSVVGVVEATMKNLPDGQYLVRIAAINLDGVITSELFVLKQKKSKP